MIKLAIVGYGKMGKEIEAILDPKIFELTGKYDIDNKIQHVSDSDEMPDVAIEFSTPATVLDNNMATRPGRGNDAHEREPARPACRNGRRGASAPQFSGGATRYRA